MNLHISCIRKSSIQPSNLKLNFSVGKSQQGDKSFKYFVKWNEKEGGHYFESKLAGDWDLEMEMIDAIACDGETGQYPPTEIFKIGCVPKLNDDVIAYYYDSTHSKFIIAYKGKSILKFTNCCSFDIDF